MLAARALIAAAAIVLGFVFSANAADYGRPLPPEQMPVFTWTGFYVGVHGDENWNGLAWKTTDDWGDAWSSNYHSQNLSYGIHAGYRWQMNDRDPVVFGIEAEGNLGNERFADQFGVVARSAWDAKLRGVAGYAIGQWLPFVTGGAAVRSFAFGRGTPLAWNETRIGWTTSVGLKYALTENFIVGAEAIYTNYPGGTHSYYDCLNSKSVINLSDQAARVLVEWKF